MDTPLTLTKRMEKILDGNCSRMLPARLNKSWKKHPTKQQLHGQLPPISKSIQIKRTRHAGHCWRSKGEPINEVLVWTPSHGRAGVGCPVRTYLQQFCTDTGCGLEDLPKAMDDIDEWTGRVWEICARSTT